MKTVTLQIELPEDLVRQYAQAGSVVNFPLPAGIFKSALGIGDKPTTLNDDDQIIAQVIDDHPGCTRAEIERIAAETLTALGTGCVKRRMSEGMPLRQRGYHTRGQKRGTSYWPPE
jgi:hypothetical protein